MTNTLLLVVILGTVMLALTIDVAAVVSWLRSRK
jgi:hypothetical protein